EHGGEAAASRDRFQGLPESDRAAVVAFLKSL
ncbi:MAG: di-heme oxidoredictase family protein, partial [Gemmatimonadales bacterium]